MHDFTKTRHFIIPNSLLTQIYFLFWFCIDASMVNHIIRLQMFIVIYVRIFNQADIMYLQDSNLQHQWGRHLPILISPPKFTLNEFVWMQIILWKKKKNSIIFVMYDSFTISVGLSISLMIRNKQSFSLFKRKDVIEWENVEKMRCLFISENCSI